MPAEMTELFFCERLSASTLRSPCEANRRNGTFACIDCPGAVISKGGIEMPVSRCNIKGCDKYQVVKGLCTAHAKEQGHQNDLDHRKALQREANFKRKAGVDRQIKVDVAAKTKTKPPVKADPLEGIDAGWQAMKKLKPTVSENFGKVKNADGQMASFGVDALIFQALTEVLEAKKAEWIADLSGLKPAKALCLTASKIEALEML